MKPSASENSKKRLQVFLSHSGFCSRRQAMALILKGCVTVNGHVVSEPSAPIDSLKDKVCVHGTHVRTKSHAYILLHKPEGYVTTKKDRHAEKIASDLLPQEYRHLYPVGRLDKDTEGLLLFTNDGDTAYRLTHPKFNVDKTYLTVIQGELKNPDQLRLEKGVVVEGKMTAPAKIAEAHFLNRKTTFKLTIHEGRKRQIRAMLSGLGYKVTYLKRISQGPLQLGSLARGRWRSLEENEVAALKGFLRQKNHP